MEVYDSLGLGSPEFTTFGDYNHRTSQILDFARSLQCTVYFAALTGL